MDKKSSLTSKILTNTDLGKNIELGIDEDNLYYVLINLLNRSKDYNHIEKVLDKHFPETKGALLSVRISKIIELAKLGKMKK